MLLENMCLFTKNGQLDVVKKFKKSLLIIF